MFQPNIMGTESPTMSHTVKPNMKDKLKNPTSSPLASLLSSLLSLGFALACHVVSKVTEHPCSDNDEARTEKDPGARGKDNNKKTPNDTELDSIAKSLRCGKSITVKCQYCEEVIEVSGKPKEILKHLKEQHPNCKDLSNISKAKPTTIEPQNPTKVCRPRKTSIDMLEEDVVCDTDTFGEGEADSRNSEKEGNTSNTTSDACVASMSKLERTVTSDVDAETRNMEGSKPSARVKLRSTRSWDPTKSVFPFPRLEDRLQTLNSWKDHSRGYDLKDICEAGLMYLGAGVNLNCYFCGIEVPGLKTFDDAWIEHAIRSPDCDYLRHKKGQDFLNTIVEIYLDGDMDAVDKAIRAVAEAKQSLDTKKFDLFNSATPTDTKIPEGAVASGYSSISTEFRSRHASLGESGGAKSGNAQRFTVDFQGGLKGGDPNYSSTPQLPTKQKTKEATSAASKGNRPAPKHVEERTPKRPVQAREVRARLDTEWAQRIMKMGYSKRLVGAVIADQLIFNGDDFASFTDFTLAVFDAADKGENFPIDCYDLGLSPSSSPKVKAKGTPNTSESKKSSDMSSAKPSAASVSLPLQSTSPPKEHAFVQSFQSLPTNPSVNSGPSPSPGPMLEQFKALELENKQLNESRLCTICFDQDRNILYRPCGHLVACHICSSKLKSCPLCRKEITKCVKVFV